MRRPSWYFASMAQTLVGALIGAGAAVVVQIIALLAASSQEHKRLEFERGRWQAEERATIRAEIRSRKQAVFVDIIGDANKVIRAVDELALSGEVPDLTPLDQDRLLRSASEVSLYAPELADRMKALSRHVSLISIEHYSDRYEEWVARARSLRNDLLGDMRASLFDVADDTSKVA